MVCENLRKQGGWSLRNYLTMPASAILTICARANHQIR